MSRDTGSAAKFSGRLFVADFDSLEQGRLWESLKPTEARRVFRGQLRLAELLVDEVVLTAAQLLDGVLFLDLGPEGLAECLGRESTSPPWLVSGLGDTLAESRSAMMSAPTFRSEALRVFGAKSAGWIESRRDLWCSASLPVEGRDDPAIQGWSAQVRALRRPDAPFPLAESLEAFEVPEVSRDAISAIMKLSDRSAVWDLLYPLSGEPPFGLTSAERESLATWWSLGYAKAIADQHQAAWLDNLAGEGSHVATARTSSVTIRGPVADRLSEFPTAMYATIHYQSASWVAAWRNGSDPDALTDVSYLVTSLGAPRGLRTQQRSLRRWRWLFLILAIVASVVGALQALNVPGTGWVVWIGLVVALAAAYPWSHDAELRELRRAKRTAIIYQ